MCAALTVKHIYMSNNVSLYAHEGKNVHLKDKKYSKIARIINITYAMNLADNNIANIFNIKRLKYNKTYKLKQNKKKQKIYIN